MVPCHYYSHDIILYTSDVYLNTIASVPSLFSLAVRLLPPHATIPRVPRPKTATVAGSAQLLDDCSLEDGAVRQIFEGLGMVVSENWAIPFWIHVRWLWFFLDSQMNDSQADKPLVSMHTDPVYSLRNLGLRSLGHGSVPSLLIFTIYGPK